MTQQNTSYQGSQFLLYLRSGLLFIVILILTAIIPPLVFLALLLPFSVRYQVAALWNKAALLATKLICGLSYEVTGLDNLPKEGGAVVLCKHQSAWETIALMTFLPTQSIVLKKSLLWIPFWGWAMAALKPIAINRSVPKEALKQLLTQGSERLTQGAWVVIFPEGTRTAPGETQKFNGGGSMLAVRANAPVVPIAHNAGQFWPRYSFLKYPGVIQVKIGPVIQVKGRKSKEVNAEAEAWINQAMQEIDVSK